MPIGPVFAWSKEDKVTETLKRSKKYFGPALQHQIDALLTPENLAILVGTLIIWAASHFIGVGEIIDVALLLVGAAMLGPAIVDVAENLLKFGKCLDARDEGDLETAAKAFADAVTQGGITTVMALLLRRGAKGVQAKAVPGVARPSVLQVVKPKGRIGLPNVGADPQAGKMWSRLPTVADPALPAGEGLTTWWGQIFYSVQGTLAEQQLVLLHEVVHKFFTPRLGFLRNFRVQLKAAGYTRSVLLKYLEEAMAETYAQLRINGIKGALTGIRFPVANNYVSISELAAEGQAIGTIVVGVQQFFVSIVLGPPDWTAEISAPTAPAPADPIRIPEVVVKGGYSVTVKPGASLSAIAMTEYNDYNLWPLIYDLNKAKIGPNPNRVKPGTSLLLLKLTAYRAADIAAARRRAPSWKNMPL